MRHIICAISFKTLQGSFSSSVILFACEPLLLGFRITPVGIHRQTVTEIRQFMPVIKQIVIINHGGMKEHPEED